ncbi:MAG: hypothetical protein PHG79_06515 [Methanosarcina sp.]|jgi:hypothetical protein|nr:hypothetical protein [Methanosarcina sp.]MDD3874915.1 hypothetical protein [Methanosarcina sp.]MDD4521486.1 hypothetical protein [Methanosarcina sp.]HHV25201.1 hypothetical protein [Methanosarcina sp.]
MEKQAKKEVLSRFIYVIDGYKEYYNNRVKITIFRELIFENFLATHPYSQTKNLKY